MSFNSYNAAGEAGKSGSGGVPAQPPEKLLASGFHELLAAAPGDEAAALGLAFSLAAQALRTGKAFCFCSAGGDAQEHGMLYGHGFAGLGLAPGRVLMVSAAKEKDLLWTIEEAVGSGAFGAVVGALGARERLYGFAASRRLKLRAMARRMPLFLIRHWSNRGATAAQGRWTVASAPSWSEGEHAGYKLPGPPRLRLALERMGGLPPQHWEMEFDAARGFHMAALLENGPHRKAGERRHQAA